MIQPIQVLSGLNCPTSINWLTNRFLVVSQRDTFMLTVQSRHSIAGSARPVTNSLVPNCVSTNGDGGLLGVAIDPNFASNRFIYVAQTIAYKGGLTADGNALVRYILGTDYRLSSPTKLVTWASNQYNNGGCLTFGPDGYLWIGTGDANDVHAAQSLISTNGKILRIQTSGQIAPGNPFGSAIYAFGLHCPTGICFEGAHCWATDCGIDGDDEINLIRSRQDYGYPLASGYNTQMNMYRTQTVAAKLASSPHEVWNPGGLAFYGSHLYVGCAGKTKADGTGAQCLGQIEIVGSDLAGKMNLFVGDYGRIGAVASGADGLYFASRNNDRVGIGAPDSVYLWTN
jgi:glucose/arabinose dehydrogenase